ncbi:MAG TPA: hypothetical protein ENK94_04340 [Campylobacterales bacterium]|nr:hypothetical protein [Campylobacterales bacterium]
MKQEHKACVRMEEGYMRATIDYSDLSYKSKITQAITSVEQRLDVHPEVINRKDDEVSGYLTVEFSGDDYTCNRNSGEFITKLLDELDISECAV